MNRTSNEPNDVEVESSIPQNDLTTSTHNMTSPHGDTTGLQDNGNHCISVLKDSNEFTTKNNKSNIQKTANRSNHENEALSFGNKVLESQKDFSKKQDLPSKSISLSVEKTQDAAAKSQGKRPFVKKTVKCERQLPAWMLCLDEPPVKKKTGDSLYNKGF